MNKIQELENKLHNLHMLKEDKQNKSILELLDKNIDEIQKEINIQKSKRLHSTKKDLRLKLANLLDLRKNTEQVSEYNKLAKEIKNVRLQIKEVSGELQFLTITQINNILKVIQKNSKSIFRDKLLILLGFELGLRASEVLDLKLSDIYINSNEVLCRRVKGSNQNRLEIKDETMLLLKKYIEETEPKEFLFSNSKGEKLSFQGLTYIFKKYCELANIPKEKAHFHTLKHSRGVWLAENGFSIQDIKYLLGHKNIRNTMIYVAFSNSQKFDIFNRLKNIPYSFRI